MNEYLKIIEEIKFIKNDLESLDRVLDDLSQPFILIKENARAKNEDEDCPVNSGASDDLDLLLKLRSVLTKAYVTDTKHNKEVNSGTTNISNKKVIKSNQCISVLSSTMKPPKSEVIHKNPPKSDIIHKNPPKSEVIHKNPPKSEVIHKNPPKSTVIPKKFSKSTLISKKPAYVPAHVTAPFKTDHNLHRPKSRSHSYHREAASNYSRSSSITSNDHILPKNKGPIVKDHKEEDKVINDKLNKDNHLIIERGVQLKEMSTVFSELKDEIKKLEEGPVTVEVLGRKPLKMTVFEAGAEMKIPDDIKKECTTRSRLLSILSNIFLNNLKTETQSSGCKYRRRFLDHLRSRSRAAERSYRLMILEGLLDDIRSLSESMDLVSSTPSQLSFMRACLAWALTEYVEIESIRAPAIEVSTKTSHMVQDKLQAKFGTASVGVPLWNQVLKTAFVTNCCFISLAPSNKGCRPCVSFIINGLRRCPFQFSFDNAILSSPFTNTHEQQSFHLSVQLQTKLLLGTLLRTWTHVLQDKSRNNEKASSFYRQMYGLLLNKYPVILRDVC